LPYDTPHIIESDSLAKADNLGMDRDNLITAIVHRPCELVAYVDAQPAPGHKDSMTFTPYQIQMIDIGFVCIIETYLSGASVILQLPIRR